MKTMNHNAYQQKTRTMSAESLRYVIRDCQEAMRANPENPNNSYYADEVCYCGMELRRRGLQA